MAKQVKTRHYKPTNERKTRVIPVRVTDDQHTKYVRLAERRKVPLSSWIREAMEAASEAE